MELNKLVVQLSEVYETLNDDWYALQRDKDSTLDELIELREEVVVLESELEEVLVEITTHLKEQTVRMVEFTLDLKEDVTTLSDSIDKAIGE